MNGMMAKGDKPDWACDAGEDGFGAYADIAVSGVRQRLRWLPPGRLLMGSPPDEPGRRDNEGPRHEVVIAQGFWMFATPVTQALWQRVMGDNPSQFKSSHRPVEQVSWDDCQLFLAQLNGCFSGLGVSLPSEAQWEYAARAGTDSALYSGAIETLREHHAPALDGIAWYGGNSGVDFELDGGWDTRDWKQQQHPAERAGSHPVALKRANPWGLFDMLGNVWEWTTDVWAEDYNDAPGDGSARQPDPGQSRTRRLLRGGSWFDTADRVRAAARYARNPASRLDVFGLRCVIAPRGASE